MRRLPLLAVLLALAALAVPFFLRASSRGAASATDAAISATADRGDPEHPEVAREEASVSEAPAHRSEASGPDVETAASTFLRITGTATDATGKPVAGARVQAALRRGGAWTLVPEATTGPDGAFEIRVAADPPSSPRAEIRLLARAAGFAPTLVHSVRRPWNRPIEIGVVTLLRPAVVEGTVIDASGAPAAGAAVVLATADDALDRAEEPFRPAFRVEASADAGGRFRAEGVPPGALRAFASKEGCTGARLEGLRVLEGATLSGLALRLAERGEIRGLVRDDGGRAIEGAEVRFVPADGEPDAARSDGEGRFVLVSVRSGARGTLAASTDALEAAPTSIVVDGSARDLTLRPRVRIAGRVVDARTGAPAAGARVVLERALNHGPRRADPPKSEHGIVSVVAGPAPAAADGAFALPVPSEGWFRVDAAAEGLAPARSDWVRAPGGAPPAPLEIALEPGRTVAGRVLDGPGSGAPPGARIALRGPRGPVDAPALPVPTDGRFAFPNLRAGTYSLETWAPGFETGRAEIVVPENADPAETEVRLRPFGGVAGRVLVRGGRPAGPIAVSARAEKRPPEVAFTDRDGRFEMIPLPAGIYRIAARVIPPRGASAGEWRSDAASFFPRSGGPPVREVVVEDGKMAEVELDLDADLPPRVHGTVRRHGAPAGGIEVAAVKPDESGRALRRTVRSTSDGTYELWVPFEGAFEVEAREANAVQRGDSRAVDASAGEEVEISFDLSGGEIRGRIASETGEAVRETQVDLAWQTAPPDSSRGTASRERAGAFAFAGLRPGSYTLTVRARDLGTVARRVELQEREIVDLGDVVLPLPVPLAVRIVREDGTPVPAGSVVVEDPSGTRVPARGGGPQFDFTGGVLELGHLGPGDWRLRMVRPFAATLDLPLTPGGRVEVEWTVRPPARKRR